MTMRRWETMAEVKRFIKYKENKPKPWKEVPGMLVGEPNLILDSFDSEGEHVIVEFFNKYRVYVISTFSDL